MSTAYTNVNGISVPKEPDRTLNVVQTMVKVLKDIENKFDQFVAAHDELDGKSKVTARVFRKLIDLHYSRVNSHCTNLSQVLQHASLEQPLLGAKDQALRDDLQAISSHGAPLERQYQQLLTKIGQTVRCSSRIDWRRQPKDDVDHHTWLQRKLRELGGGSPDLTGIAREVRSVHDILGREAKKVPAIRQKTTKSVGSPPTAGGLSPSPLFRTTAGKGWPVGPKPEFTIKNLMKDHDSEWEAVEPSAHSSRKRKHIKRATRVRPRKRAKKAAKAGDWHGKDSEKLYVNKKLNDIIAEYEKYLRENPECCNDQKGHFNKMEGFLDQALKSIGFGKHKTHLTELKTVGPGAVDVGFLDFDFRPSSSPTFLNAAARAQKEGKSMLNLNFPVGDPNVLHYGFNYYKESVLKGGLTTDEKRNLSTPDVATPKTSGGAPGPDGGGVAGFDAKKAEATRLVVAEERYFKWSNPAELWEQIHKDSTVPKSKAQVQRYPDADWPLMNPDDDLTDKPRKHYQNQLGTIYEHHKTSLNDIKNQADVQELKDQAQRLVGDVDKQMSRVKRWLRDGDGHFFPTYCEGDKEGEPTPRLGENPAPELKVTRFDGSHKEHFAILFNGVFKIRIWQTMRLVILNKLYKLGEAKLVELVRAERDKLEGWWYHEEVWGEYDDNRHIALKKSKNYKRLVNRHTTRKRMQKLWSERMKRLGEVIEELEATPDKFDAVLIQNEAAAKAAAEKAAAEAAAAEAARRAELLKAGVTASTNGKPSSARPSPPPPPPSSSPPCLPTPPTPPSDDESSPDDDDVRRDGSPDPGPDTSDGENSDGNEDGTKGQSGPAKPSETLRLLAGFRRVRDSAQQKASRAKERNDKLDDGDPGNEHLIQANNQVIMSANQSIWGMDCEIHALEQGSVPDATKKPQWTPPEDTYYWRNTKPIRKKQDPPLDIVSLGPGPIPGEHPTPTSTRVLVGAPPGFGYDPPKKPSAFTLSDITGVTGTFGTSPEPSPSPTRPTDVWKNLLKDPQGFRQTLSSTDRADEVKWRYAYAQKLEKELKLAKSTQVPVPGVRNQMLDDARFWNKIDMLELRDNMGATESSKKKPNPLPAIRGWAGVNDDAKNLSYDEFLIRNLRVLRESLPKGEKLIPDDEWVRILAAASLYSTRLQQDRLDDSDPWRTEAGAVGEIQRLLDVANKDYPLTNAEQRQGNRFVVIGDVALHFLNRYSQNYLRPLRMPKRPTGPVAPDSKPTTEKTTKKPQPTTGLSQDKNGDWWSTNWTLAQLADFDAWKDSLQGSVGIVFLHDRWISSFCIAYFEANIAAGRPVHKSFEDVLKENWKTTYECFESERAKDKGAPEPYKAARDEFVKKNIAVATSRLGKDILEVVKPLRSTTPADSTGPPANPLEQLLGEVRSLYDDAIFAIYSEAIQERQVESEEEPDVRTELAPYFEYYWEATIEPFVKKAFYSKDPKETQGLLGRTGKYFASQTQFKEVDSRVRIARLRTSLDKQATEDVQKTFTGDKTIGDGARGSAVDIMVDLIMKDMGKAVEDFVRGQGDDVLKGKAFAQTYAKVLEDVMTKRTKIIKDEQDKLAVDANQQAAEIKKLEEERKKKEAEAQRKEDAEKKQFELNTRKYADRQITDQIGIAVKNNELPVYVQAPLQGVLTSYLERFLSNYTVSQGTANTNRATYYTIDGSIRVVIHAFEEVKKRVQKTVVDGKLGAAVAEAKNKDVLLAVLNNFISDQPVLDLPTVQSDMEDHIDYEVKKTSRAWRKEQNIAIESEGQSESEDDDAGIQGSDGWPDFKQLFNSWYTAKLADVVLSPLPVREPAVHLKKPIHPGKAGFPSPRWIMGDKGKWVAEL
ncbi:Uu.00g047810.m01.CDS01 [Anthostomella pinea]|uniref:Uu.00g047810.m01.CDS01 n=1 Tax=Anthostomella pinea TaxID=933095 RepID=A0AAI8VBQ1_9PEZI|nr:Uu.00g047810.m01.CDS01 [Anthostomella pinea]